MNKYTIKIFQSSKTKGVILAADGKLEIESKHVEITEHDMASFVFAIEFAANNHSEIPMRIHIIEDKQE